MKRLFALTLIACLMIGTFSGCKKGELIFYDNSGKVIASVASSKELKTKSRSKEYAMLDGAFREAVQQLCEKDHCEAKVAEKRLFDHCKIYTTFDTDAVAKIQTIYKNQFSGGIPFGCALIKPNGETVALFSNGSANENHAVQPKSPYSALKPLAIYAPAIESGMINWSSVFEDSPYKKITDSSGKLVDWPVNADNRYSLQPETVCTAIKRSLNTVAVKCLAKYGVENSMSFLTQKLGIDLSDEYLKMQMVGEDEIIGNIAMGYLSKGVSPLDMAGYYQMFSNSGVYIKPYCITKICDEKGEIYSNRVQAKSVLDESTACIMTHLLQEVVSFEGTGKAAEIKNAHIAGKTGTGNTGEGNWFVGFSSDCTCAVWHGAGTEKNYSPAVFAEVVQNCNLSGKGEYPTSDRVKEAAFCAESGLLLSDKCVKMEIGYYKEENLPQKCNNH